MNTTTTAERPGLFEPCMAFVKSWEGGWSDHPDDPGGLTRWGITIRTVVAAALDFNGDGLSNAADLADMTEGQAELVYRRMYWQAAGCQRLPGPLALLVFCSAVNQGPQRAVRFLQASVGTDLRVDGVHGPNTARAVAEAWRRNPERMLRDFAVARALHYSGLVQFVTFGRGWLRRLFAAHAVATLALELELRGEAPARAVWQALGRAGAP